MREIYFYAPFTILVNLTTTFILSHFYPTLKVISKQMTYQFLYFQVTFVTKT